jgi:hypothetical protein
MRKIFAFLFLIVFLTACGLVGSPTQESTPIPGATESPAPTSTFTPEPVTPLVILVLPEDMVQAEAERYQSTVYELAQASGYRFQVRSGLTESDVQNEPGLGVIIAIGVDPGLVSLATAAPAVQFLGANISGLTPTANLSSVGASSNAPIQQAFIAGYMAALLSPDYRVGLITMEDDAGQKAITAFTNGRAFYCGLCNPAFPPFYKYPVHPQIPLNTQLNQYPYYSDYFLDMLVDVAYVEPRAATPELLDYMAQRGLLIISERLPFESLQTNWVASLQPDLVPAIQRLWPDLIAGRGGQTISTPLLLTDVNPELLPDGKQGMVQELLDNLLLGLVDTGVNP